ncbi:BRO family protein [Clostridium butyricum]
MSQELKIINNQKILEKDFKIYGSIENPLFLAKDVAEWIEHSNQRMMLKSVDEDEKQCVNNPYALQGFI